MSYSFKNIVQNVLGVCAIMLISTSAMAETFLGELDVFHVDIPAKSEYRYYLRLDGATPVLLDYAESPSSDFQTGTKVQVEGDFERRDPSRGGNIIRVQSIKRQVSLLRNKTTLKYQALAAPQTRTVGVFLISAPGLSAPTASGMRGTMYDRTDSVRSYFDVSSYGQVILNGDANLDGNPDVMGPYAISADVANNCDVYGMVSVAEAQAKAEGYDVSKYQHRVLALPELPACKWSGLGSMGCGSYCYSWGKGTYPPLYAHEIGHNLGMHHAALDFNNDSKIDDEYGDPTDAMGNRSYGTANAPHRVQLDWTRIKSDMVVTVSQGNIFTISSLDVKPDSSVTNPQILRIPIVNSTNAYYLALRTAVAPFGVAKEHLNRVSLHTWSGKNQTLFLRSLGAGQSFSDEANGLTISVVSADANGATLQIDKTGSSCVRAAPTLTTAAASVLTAPGKTLSVNASLRNNDSTACAASSFALQATSVAGIVSSVSPTTLNLAPGATGSVSLSLAIAATVASGQYGITLGTLADTNHAVAQTNISLRVDASVPSVPQNFSGVATNGSINLTWSAATDAESGIKQYRVMRSGVALGVTTETKYADTSVQANTSYRYQIVAENGVGLVSSSSEINVTAVGGTASGEVCFYEHINYAGASFCVGAGAGVVNASWVKKVSSIKVVDGFAVDLFDGANQTGRRLTFVRSMEDMPRVGFNDVVTSWNVQPRNQGNVVSGVVYSMTAQHSGLVADVKGESIYNGAAIHQWKWWNGNNQKWQMNAAADGYFRVVSVKSNKCMSPKGNSFAALTPLTQENCNDYPVRRWYFRAQGNGFELVNVRSGMCVEVANANLANGGVLQENFCSGGTNQRWTLTVLP
jgi:hypothetical protein